LHASAPPPRRALTIAGSDSCGGAGIQADLKTFAAHGVYGLSAITAVTAQNSREVRGVAAVAPEMVAAQIDAVLDDVGADAVKIGMLWSAATARRVAESLRRHFAPAPGAGSGAAGRRWLGGLAVPVVFDPVLAAGTGAALVAAALAGAPGDGWQDQAGVPLTPLPRLAPPAPLPGGVPVPPAAPFEAMAAAILPLAALVTPNLPELLRLTGAPAAAGEEERLALARRLAATGPAVLAKGGHDETTPGEVVDLLVVPAGRGGPERVVRFAAPRLGNRAPHGTGCTLSAAVAARLAAGDDLETAVGGAIAYVRRAILASPPLGGGAGLLGHFWDSRTTPG
jgi:hydroxymethylpyrimidine/phosphomethylpyrimidine kinase